MNYNELKLKNW